jgi:hypothetical protein
MKEQVASLIDVRLVIVYGIGRCTQPAQVQAEPRSALSLSLRRHISGRCTSDNSYSRIS